MPGLSDSSEMLRFRKKLSIEVLWIYILSLLKEKPFHAYAIRKRIFERFGFLPGNVSSYVVLYKLESRGFVSTEKEKNRVVYTLTDKGRELFSLAEKELHKTIEKLF